MRKTPIGWTDGEVIVGGGTPQPVVSHGSHAIYISVQLALDALAGKLRAVYSWLES